MNNPVKPSKRISTQAWTRTMQLLAPQLRKVADSLTTIDEQILFVMSMLSTCSSLFTRLKTYYHQRPTFPNLFFIATAPPAAGKGSMIASRMALGKIHEYLLKDSRIKQETYKEKLTAALKSKTPPPEKPPFVVLFLPGNCTSSRMIEHMASNGLYPLAIHETEAKTLSSANSSQYGDFSDLVLKSFQGETIGYTRKMNSEFIEVKEPKLSITLSGTLDQVINLIGTPSDGSMSRYLMFAFEGTDEWLDGRNTGGANFTELVLSQQDYYFDLWAFYSDRDVRFDFTDKQWDEMNALFKEEHMSVKEAGNVYATGLVKRHGLMFIKMCMVLTAFRMFDLNIKESVIECLDRDFEIAKQLISISLECSLEVLEQLPKPKVAAQTKDKKADFFQLLKESFTTTEAINIGAGLKVTSRTVYRWLERLTSDGCLSNDQHGVYLKMSV